MRLDGAGANGLRVGAHGAASHGTGLWQGRGRIFQFRSRVSKAAAPAIDLDHDATRYFDYHHTANDTLDKVEPEALRFNVAAWATFLYFAAETATEFGPLESDEQVRPLPLKSR